jgi:hypothetical protein
VHRGKPTATRRDSLPLAPAAMERPVINSAVAGLIGGAFSVENPRFVAGDLLRVYKMKSKDRIQPIGFNSLAEMPKK